jgi:hypothetical protein
MNPRTSFFIALLIGVGAAPASAFTIEAQFRSVLVHARGEFEIEPGAWATYSASDEAAAPDFSPFSADLLVVAERSPGVPGTEAVLGHVSQSSLVSATHLHAEGAASIVPQNGAVLAIGNWARSLFDIQFTVDVPTEVRLSGSFLAADRWTFELFGPTSLPSGLPIDGTPFVHEFVLAPGSYELYFEAEVLGPDEPEDPYDPATSYAIDLQVIPEPATALLLLGGLAGLAGGRRRSGARRVG